VNACERILRRNVRKDREVRSRLLTIEDDDDVRMMLKMVLEDEGYEVSEAGNGADGLRAFIDDKPSLVLVDLKLPDMSGFDICRTIRQTSDVPIIIVTAQEDSFDVVAGLESGADDYVTKPFKPKELAARIRAHLRRVQPTRPVGGTHPAGPVRLVHGNLSINVDEGYAAKHDQNLGLTKTEFRLLVLLATNPLKVYSREQLLEQVWGHDFLADSRLVDAHVRRLRTKVEDDPAEPRFIMTARGLGYRFVP
jgi:DNA-binding response OmpR family regulator